MFELVLANLRTRLFRTLISTFGVALGVTLVVMFTGLADGMSESMIKRASNWKAEIVFTRPEAMGLIISNVSVSTKYAEKLLEIKGIKSAIPVIRYITQNEGERWGIQQLDGVDWKPFAEMNDMQIIAGRAPASERELILDERHMKDKKYSINDFIEIFGKDFKIVGVFSPPSGARLKMSLKAMQNLLQSPNKCTYILVKINKGADVNEVAARINKKLPGNTVNLTSDLIIDAKERIPGLETFLNVLTGLGTFVSMIFVLLSMYTTITERRKEIGILKSLGASKSFIIKVIEGEAFLIGVFGIIIGFLMSFGAAFSIEKIFELPFKFSPGWIATSFTIAIFGSLIGALYPAWRASNIDPIMVLTNE